MVQNSKLCLYFILFLFILFCFINFREFQGHDSTPMLFMYTNETLKFVTKLDIPSEQKSTNTNSAMQKFRNIDRNAASEALNIKLKTLHQNAIM